ncbi:hypothetical protein IMZ48_43645 [Candidatus Bathyarchaeota archaeon]|nr:hypothetical protein [Candidatus Bathyarchaeota archaeon]
MASSPIIAPIIQVTTYDESKTDLAPYIFLERRFEDVVSPMIFRTDDLSLVYAGQQYEGVMDVRAQTLNKKTLLTFWEGEGASRYGNGHCLAFDGGYELKYNITPIGLETDSLADLHEFQVTEEDTVLIVIFEPIPWDLTPVGGPEDGMLIDCLFQEIDPRTGELIFEWRASEHYGLEDTMSTIETHMLPTGFNWYHLNSVAKVCYDPLSPLPLSVFSYPYPSATPSVSPSPNQSSREQDMKPHTAQYGSNYLIGGADVDHVALIDGTTGNPI